ncbi:unnamed protein product, partial [Urochloa humidicola]
GSSPSFATHRRPAALGGKIAGCSGGEGLGGQGGKKEEGEGTSRTFSPAAEIDGSAENLGCGGEWLGWPTGSTLRRRGGHKNWRGSFTRCRGARGGDGVLREPTVAANRLMLIQYPNSRFSSVTFILSTNTPL